MVSGLVTSPCDQLRIFSGEARLMRIASKSAIGFAMSKGLERYKVVLRFLRPSRCRVTAPGNNWPATRGRFPQGIDCAGAPQPASLIQNPTKNCELKTRNCFY